jgi:DNA-binding XRE family transcriptional regulator
MGGVMAKPSQRSQRARSDEKRSADKDAELVALGKRLAELRERAGMTQESLADASGLHWTYVGQIERGERNLTYKNLLKLARGLDLDPAELLKEIPSG